MLVSELIMTVITNQEYMKKKLITRQIPGLPFADINFANNTDFIVMSVDLHPQIEINQFLIRWSKSEPQWQ